MLSQITGEGVHESAQPRIFRGFAPVLDLDLDMVPDLDLDRNGCRYWNPAFAGGPSWAGGTIYHLSFINGHLPFGSHLQLIQATK